VTTKKLAFKSVVGELCAFLRASRSAADFRALGCKVWDQNANENQQWLDNPTASAPTTWARSTACSGASGQAKVLDAANQAQIANAQKNGFTIVAPLEEDGVQKVLLYKAIDQLRECLDTIVNNPGSRRILFHGWNPAVLDAVALPACHLLYQFIPNPRPKNCRCASTCARTTWAWARRSTWRKARR
jgi:thymidylate synthase